MYGKLGEEIGQILSTVYKITGINLIRGRVCLNYVLLYVSVPPKMSISDVVSKLKGKGALMIFDRHPEYRDKYESKSFMIVCSAQGHGHKYESKSFMVVCGAQGHGHKYDRHFWPRGNFAETIGRVNEEMIKKYIEEQE